MKQDQFKLRERNWATLPHKPESTHHTFTVQIRLRHTRTPLSYCWNFSTKPWTPCNSETRTLTVDIKDIPTNKRRKVEVIIKQSNQKFPYPTKGLYLISTYPRSRRKIDIWIHCWCPAHENFTVRSYVDQIGSQVIPTLDTSPVCIRITCRIPHLDGFL